MSDILELESVSFQSAAKVGIGNVMGASSSPAGGNQCEILADVESRIVHIKHLASKRMSLVPFENVAGMVPKPPAPPKK